MKIDFSVIFKFWKDVKELQKKKIKVLQSDYSAEQFLELNDDEKIESIPVLNAIKNTIENAILDTGIGLDAISDKIDQQPYLTDGWVLRKMRYGIDNTGKRGGLRLVFAVSEATEAFENVFIIVDKKNNVQQEREFRKETFERFKDYLDK